MSMQYQEPNFDLLADFPQCSFVQAPKDCVLPEGFMCTTNFPTYVHTSKGWLLAQQPRMDSHLVWVPDEQKVYTKFKAQSLTHSSNLSVVHSAS